MRRIEPGDFNSEIEHVHTMEFIREPQERNGNYRRGWFSRQAIEIRRRMTAPIPVLVTTVALRVQKRTWSRIQFLRYQIADRLLRQVECLRAGSPRRGHQRVT